jgi:EAL domain-containing protein (putative c-di-GMP-specific phosphodiesterase class I)
VLIEDVEDDSAVLSTAERIVQLVRKPFHAEDRAVHIHTSIGIAFATDGGTSDMLLRNADLAMYTAKRQGKDRFAVYESEMHAAALARLELEGDLRRALTSGEFLLHYQPVVDMTNGRIVGVEALVRWNHPERGLLNPGSFIGLAEETGLIVELGRQVLSQACREAAGWPVVQEGGDFYVTVNISARQLETTLVDDVLRSLDASGLPATSLVLEMTETGMMEDTTVAIAAFETLKQLGIRIAIDDFGTGYSSLSYLQRFPIDILKIDRSFVSTIDTQHGDKSLVRTIISLARTLNLTAVAEGVETVEQADALLKLGCVLAQGFHYWKPMEAAAIPEVLARATPIETSAGR